MPVEKTIRKVFFDVSDELSATIAEQVSSQLELKRVKGSVHKRIIEYAAYNNIAEAEADYTICLKVEQGVRKAVTVRPFLVKHCTGNPTRDTARSHEAVNKLEHELRLIGRKPSPGGAEIIPWEAVKQFPWFWKSTEPYLILCTQCRQGNEPILAGIIADGILDYFGRR